jgi:hypothetical protein
MLGRVVRRAIMTELPGRFFRIRGGVVPSLIPSPDVAVYRKNVRVARHNDRSRRIIDCPMTAKWQSAKHSIYI